MFWGDKIFHTNLTVVIPTGIFPSTLTLVLPGKKKHVILMMKCYSISILGLRLDRCSTIDANLRRLVVHYFVHCIIFLYLINSAVWVVWINKIREWSLWCSKTWKNSTAVCISRDNVPVTQENPQTSLEQTKKFSWGPLKTLSSVSSVDCPYCLDTRFC